MKLIMSDRPLDIHVQPMEDIRYFDLSSLKIANCMGCFGCWTKTPGRCVIRDDATQIYPCIAQSETVLYVSRLAYGGYDTPMKTMLERAIPVQQAFIRIHQGETHHVQRDVKLKRATIIDYGDTDEEAVCRCPSKRFSSILKNLGSSSASPETSYLHSDKLRFPGIRTE